MIKLLIILGWVIMMLVAYPRHKKWVIGDRGWSSNRDSWTNSNMLFSIFVCFVAWYVVLIWYVCVTISEMEIVNRVSRWMDRPSIDSNISEYFKKIFRK